MLMIKVLGAGCPNCKRLEKIAHDAAEKLNASAEIIKVTNYSEIAELGVMSTPGLIINDEIVSTGRVPAPEEVSEWIQNALTAD